jgi:hypothetical protein
MRDVFFFDAMLTPKIITFVYWLLLLIAVVSGFGSMFGGYGGVRLWRSNFRKVPYGVWSNGWWRGGRKNLVRTVDRTF